MNQYQELDDKDEFKKKFIPSNRFIEHLDKIISDPPNSADVEALKLMRDISQKSADMNIAVENLLGE